MRIEIRTSKKFSHLHWLRRTRLFRFPPLSSLLLCSSYFQTNFPYFLLITPIHSMIQKQQPLWWKCHSNPEVKISDFKKLSFPNRRSNERTLCFSSGGATTYILNALGQQMFFYTTNKLRTSNDTINFLKRLIFYNYIYIIKKQATNKKITLMMTKRIDIPADVTSAYLAL